MNGGLARSFHSEVHSSSSPVVGGLWKLCNSGQEFSQAAPFSPATLSGAVVMNTGKNPGK